ncbi:MAG: thiolase family protein [Firmicutes bacterium]|nr:thiolase family protein [Bacillota bacterium]
MEKIAIVGVAQTKFEKAKPTECFADLVYEVTIKALEDAGMTIGDIDNVITVSNDFWDGRTISSMAVQDACGSYGKNISTVEGDGTYGAIYGALRVLSGSYKNTLVVSHCKGSMSDNSIITNGAFDPIYTRSLGLDSISSSALQARRFMEKYGITEEQCALVSVKNHQNAFKNPYAQLPLDITVEDVMKSRKLADPIKLLDASPITDGAAAIIISNQVGAKFSPKPPVWIRAMAHCTDAYFLGDRDLAEADALVNAAVRAYEMAGITDPASEIDVFELYDAFSYQELLWMEALGLCGQGKSGRVIESGATAIDGSMPINPSGGVISAHPVMVAGLVRIIEAVLQVRGEAGEHQVPGVKTALAHGLNGACGQGHGIFILGR